VVDLDKVQLDMPADTSAEPSINMDDPFGTGSKPADGASAAPGAEPAMPMPEPMPEPTAPEPAPEGAASTPQ